MIDAIRIDNSGPTVSSRNLAILHVGIFDAVNSIRKTHQPYQTQSAAPTECSAEAAATAASHEIMNTLYPGMSGRSDDLFAQFIAQAQRTAALTNGLELGREVGRFVLQARAADGASTDVPYIPSLEPGRWQRTGPLFRPPFTPQWRYVDLFGLPNLERFAAPAPPALDSAEYAAAVNEVKSIGASNSSVRTAEQREIAIFWSDFSYTSMPPGHWHLIAEGIARERQTSFEDCARLFALISIAQADAAVVCWEAKFRHDLWRPVTAIQRANEDGNELTEGDPNWNSLLAAPPFPAYFSGHSSFSAASAEVIARFYGTDNIAFTATSDSLPGVYRRFESLRACADEVGRSRIYGGIHFSFDNVEGKKSGRAIGEFISLNYLLPNDGLPKLVIEPDGSLRLHGHHGRTLIVEHSADLRTWISASVHTAQPGGVAATNAPMGFYRIRETD